MFKNFELLILNSILCEEGGEGGAPQGGGTESPQLGGAPEGGSGDNMQNTNKGGLDQFVTDLPEGITKNDEINPDGAELKAPELTDEKTEVDISAFDEMFDWEDGEKEALMEKIKTNNITPEQFNVFQEMTGEMVNVVNEMSEQNGQLKALITRDFQGEATKLAEQGWTKQDVNDIIDFTGNLLGEGGADRLRASINNADVLFALKAMKDAMVGDDNALEQRHADKETEYSQDDFLRDQETLRMMKDKGATPTELDEFMKKSYDKVRRLGSKKLKEDLAHIL